MKDFLLFTGVGNIHAFRVLMSKIEELPDLGGGDASFDKTILGEKIVLKNVIEYRGTLDLNGICIPCYVLKDGTRVLSGRGLQEALKMVDGSKKASGHRVVRYLNQKNTYSVYFQIFSIGPL